MDDADPVVRAIIRRARKFQGWRGPSTIFEPLLVQRYGSVGGIEGLTLQHNAESGIEKVKGITIEANHLTHAFTYRYPPYTKLDQASHPSCLQVIAAGRAQMESQRPSCSAADTF